MSDEQTQAAPQKMVQVTEDALAVVCIKRADADADVEQFECSRNVFKLHTEIGQRVDVDDDTIKVEVSLPAIDPDGDKKVVLCIYHGTPKQVLSQLEAKMVNPNDAIMALRRFIAEMGELSMLKGVILSAVFDEVGVGGFGMLNNHVEIASEDIVMLHESASGQAEVFKATMAAKGVKFPDDDDSGIIVPPGAGVISG